MLLVFREKFTCGRLWYYAEDPLVHNALNKLSRRGGQKDRKAFYRHELDALENLGCEVKIVPENGCVPEPSDADHSD